MLMTPGWSTHRLPTGRHVYVPIMHHHNNSSRPPVPVPGEKAYDHSWQAWDAAWRFLNPGWIMTFFGTFRNPFYRKPKTKTKIVVAAPCYYCGGQHVPKTIICPYDRDI